VSPLASHVRDSGVELSSYSRALLPGQPKGLSLRGLLARRNHLEAVVSVDAKAQDCGDVYGLIVSHGGLEFPTAKCG
jgi:hypothetical protein